MKPKAEIKKIEKYVLQKEERRKKLKNRELEDDSITINWWSARRLNLGKKNFLRENRKKLLHKWKYREYIKRRTKNVIHCKHKWKIVDGRPVVRVLQNGAEYTLAEKREIVNVLERIVGRENLKKILFRDLLKIYKLHKYVEDYVDLKFSYEDIREDFHEGAMPAPSIFMYYKSGGEITDDIIRSAILELKYVRRWNMKFRKRFTPDELYEKIREYFHINDKIVEERLLARKGIVIKGKFKVPYSWAGLANFLGTTTRALYKYRWEDNYRDFWDIMDWAADMIEQRCIECAATGEFDPQFIKFILKNLNNTPHYYSEKTIEDRNKKAGSIVIKGADGKTFNIIKGEEIKQIEEESKENKKNLGIDIINEIKKKDKEEHEYIEKKQREKVENNFNNDAIDISFTDITENNNEKKQ